MNNNETKFPSGADCVINIIEDMTGQRPSVYFKVCWRYIIPLLSLVSQKFNRLYLVTINW